MSKRELGYRLWTSLKEIDAEIVANSSLEEQGATASTTIIRGDDIITATIGDSVSFAILYDALGAPFVYRLNHRLHSPDEPQELERLKELGQTPVQVDADGNVYPLTDHVSVQTEVRLPSGINMSRSVGDKTSRPYGATADADIDIHSLSELKTLAKANAGFTGEVSKIQIMVACDGFTNIVDKGCKGKSTEEHKAKQESFLRYCLNYDSELKAVSLDESTLAERCAKICLEAPHKKKNNPSESTKYLEEFRIHGDLTESSDNISVAIQTVPLEQSLDEPFAVMLGVFDGHGGNAVSRKLARSIQGKLTHQLQLSPEQYADQTLSVYNRSEDYERDNKKLLEANAEKLYSLVDKLHKKMQYIKVILLSSEPLPGDFKYQERMDECKELLKQIHTLTPYFSRVKNLQNMISNRIFEQMLGLELPRLMEKRKTSSVEVSPSAVSIPVSKEQLHHKIDEGIKKLIQVTSEKMKKTVDPDQASVLGSIRFKLNHISLQLEQRYSREEDTKAFADHVVALVAQYDATETHSGMQKLYSWIRQECRSSQSSESHDEKPGPRV